MAAVAPVLPTIIGVASTLRTIEGAINTFKNFGGQDEYRKGNLQYQQALEMQRLKAMQGAQQAQLAHEEQLAKSQQDEEQRRAALRRAVARQRAQFGSQGVAEGGSSDAVLLGLFQESEAEKVERQRLDDIKARSIDLGVEQQNSINLLQASQLAEKNKLNRFF